MGRLGNAEPASVIGAVVDLVAAASAGIIAERGAVYGDAATSMAAAATRWSITLGHPVTPAQVVLCLIDLEAHAAPTQSEAPGFRLRPRR